MATDDQPITLAELMPGPARARRSKRPWRVAAIGVAAVVVVAGIAVFAWSVRPVEAASRSLGPLAKDAARECRDAIAAEGRRRVDAAAQSGNGLATATVSDVTVTEPRWGETPHAWTVDGTIKFSIASMLGILPTSVDVRCKATRSAGGQLVTLVANR
ncbi:hypothetical protein ACPPVO_52900 [Dactylosporangium sp. McL0621]|uniref:hypothetical protein n=1 Tax=Dactylosporangium sp. McL0621 TaxID=3415678 RepID=UPI003CF94C15